MPKHHEFEPFLVSTSPRDQLTGFLRRSVDTGAFLKVQPLHSSPSPARILRDVIVGKHPKLRINNYNITYRLGSLGDPRIEDWLGVNTGAPFRIPRMLHRLMVGCPL